MVEKEKELKRKREREISGMCTFLIRKQDKKQNDGIFFFEKQRLGSESKTSVTHLRRYRDRKVREFPSSRIDD